MHEMKKSLYNIALCLNNKGLEPTKNTMRLSFKNIFTLMTQDTEARKYGMSDD